MIQKIADLFKKKEPQTNFIVAQLNDKIMPIDRGEVYEDPLDELLKNNNIGEVSGGGTLQEKSGEIRYCDIEIRLFLNEIEKYTINEIINKLENLGAPKGSKILVEKTGTEIPFGQKEGLGIYLDGQNLDEEVYAQSDINFVLSEIFRLTGIDDTTNRYWEGETGTALYFYGESFEKMNNDIFEFVQSYPLCKNARIQQIA